jgi:hypothetical protein
MEHGMLVAGGIGTGLVVGWVAARLSLAAPWNVRVWVLLSTIALGLIVFQIATPAATIGFAAALVVAALICYGWLRGLARRRAARPSS